MMKLDNADRIPKEGTRGTKKDTKSGTSGISLSVSQLSLFFIF